MKKIRAIWLYLCIFCAAIFLVTFYFRTASPKVLLIGLDGASWNVIMPLIRDNKLPNIQRLMREGSYGNLKSIWPFYSEVVWTTIATGKAPLENGITDRLVKDHNSGNYIPPTSNLRKTKALWNILSEKNRLVGLIGYLVTWPPEPVNGVLVSDRLISAYDLDYNTSTRSYPPFSRLIPEEKFEEFKVKKQKSLANIDKNKFFDFWDEVEDVDHFMGEFSKFMLKKTDFDFFCLYLRGIDVTSHSFWRYLSRQPYGETADGSSKYSRLITEYYIWCDKIIGEMAGSFGKDAFVIVVSDHGFDSVAGNKNWFEKVNYLLKISGVSEFNTATGTVKLVNEPQDKFSCLKHVRIAGNVSRADFDYARNKSISVLKEISIPQTGEHPFSDISPTADGFLINVSIRLLDPDARAHTLIINGINHKLEDLLANNTYSGEHSDRGVFFISGPGVLRHNLIPSLNIYDVFPTVLYCMGLPVPRDISGRVLLEAFVPYNKRRVTRVDTYEDGKGRWLSSEPVRRISDEERIKEKMKSLGYLN